MERIWLHLELHFQITKRLDGILGVSEDTIARSQKSLIAGIYGHLFTPCISYYDRNSTYYKYFVRAWCQSNTVLASIGELSIYLRDLYILGGLPSGGSLYEKVIPEDTELTGTDAKDQSTLPSSL
ncbi:hypothetical protein HAX54_048254 [Datura stramonium]|uniref:Uncharacterized protein n=1 Tax=Datura stramonium TaxID=4076 RepID=A0ABS8STK9_DATST|nr:hypothetical protein [Datura stramonium]